MANTWGDSWGTAWGDSWGAAEGGGDEDVSTAAIAQLANSFRNVRNGSLYAWEDENLLGGFFDPAHYSAISQLVNSFRNVRINSLYAREDENLLAGYFQAEQFRWNAPTDRMARSSGRWTPETYPDNAWLYSVQPVVEVFDPALFPAIAELVGVRTPMAASLAVAYYLALYDMGWLHDVIPLTDPVPGAEIIHLRPIAPVMSARRRNKRRR